MRICFESSQVFLGDVLTEFGCFLRGGSVKRRRRDRSGTAIYKDNVACHICGLPIPTWLVCSDHPLFGTIDHIVPKAAGGGDTAENRAPAHACCNQAKGNRPELSQPDREEIRTAALTHLSRISSLPDGKCWKRVRRAVAKINGDSVLTRSELSAGLNGVNGVQALPPPRA